MNKSQFKQHLLDKKESYLEEIDSWIEDTLAPEALEAEADGNYSVTLNDSSLPPEVPYKEVVAALKVKGFDVQEVYGNGVCADMIIVGWE